MSDDQFTKLFRYIEDFRADVTKKLDEKASQSSVDALTGTVDGLAKRVDDYEIERTARDAQFNRLKNWARGAGTKVNHPLQNL